MAWQSVPMYRPIFRWWGAESLTVPETTLTSTQTRVAAVFTIPRSGYIEKLAFRISSVTTAADLSIGLYTVDTSGNPTTTTYGGSGAATLSALGVTAGVKEVTLPTAAGATAGDLVAFVVEWAGTPGELSLRYQTGNPQIPYNARYSSGTWTKIANYIIQSVLAYSDGSYYVAGTPVAVDSQISFHINSTPDERGNLFQFPFGVRFNRVEHILSDSGQYDVVVYIGNNSISRSVPTFLPSGTQRTRIIDLPGLVEVPANTPFRIVIKPTTTTNVTGLVVEQFNNVGHKDAWLGVGVGSQVQMTTRTDGGAWSDDNLKFHLISPIIAEIDVGGSSAGGGFPFPPHVIIT